MFRRIALTTALFITLFALASQNEARVYAQSICRGCAEIGMGCCLVNGSFHCC